MLFIYSYSGCQCRLTPQFERMCINIGLTRTSDSYNVLPPCDWIFATSVGTDWCPGCYVDLWLVSSFRATVAEFSLIRWYSTCIFITYWYLEKRRAFLIDDIYFCSVCLSVCLFACSLPVFFMYWQSNPEDIYRFSRICKIDNKDILKMIRFCEWNVRQAKKCRGNPLFVMQIFC